MAIEESFAAFERTARLSETVYGVVKRWDFVQDALRTTRLIDPSILDVGCGTGELLSIPLAAQGFRVHGIDVNRASIEHAQALARRQGLESASFETVTLDQLDQRFEVVLLSEVIEHVADPARLVQQIRDRLVPGGYLIITLPNGYGPFEIEDFFWSRNFLGLTWLHSWYTSKYGHESLPATCNESTPHIQFFTWKRINRLLSENDFQIVNYRPRTFLAGSYSSSLVHGLSKAGFGSDWLVNLNARVVDYLPPQIVAGWMFLCRRTLSHGEAK